MNVSIAGWSCDDCVCNKRKALNIASCRINNVVPIRCIDASSPEPLKYPKHGFAELWYSFNEGYDAHLSISHEVGCITADRIKFKLRILNPLPETGVGSDPNAVTVPELEQSSNLYVWLNVSPRPNSHDNNVKLAYLLFFTIRCSHCCSPRLGINAVRCLRYQCTCCCLLVCVCDNQRTVLTCHAYTGVRASKQL